MSWQSPRAVKAGSVRRVAASCIAVAVAGCGGGSDGDGARGASALEGVAAHRLADAPHLSGRVGMPGHHPVRAGRRLRLPADHLYGEWYLPADLRGRRPAVVAFGGSDGGLTTKPLARAFARSTATMSSSP